MTPRSYSFLIFILLLLLPTFLFSQNPFLVESEENDQKIQDFALLVQNAIAKNNADAYSELIDLSYIKSKLQYAPQRNQTQKDFEKGFYIGLENSSKIFAQQLSDAVQNGAYYDFISYRYDENIQTYYALFRFFDTENGINYHDYKISEVNGIIKSDDLYIYLTGENLSATYARVYLFSMLNLNASKNENGLLEIGDFKTLASAIDLNSKGEFEEAYNALDAIEGDLAKDKFVQLVKIRVASRLNMEKYIDAIEALKNTHEQDPTIYLTLIDYYLANKEYDRAYDLIDNLQMETEDDFLYYFKGNLEYQRKNYESAENFFKYIIENFTDFFQGYVGYLMALTQQGKFNEAVLLLDKLVELGYDREALVQFIEENDDNGHNELASLATSEVFGQWKKEIKY